MKTALVLNAINPGIGGVLIRGQRGTAKSTAVRALARLLPEIDVIVGCRYRCDPERRRPGVTTAAPVPMPGRRSSWNAAGCGSWNCPVNASEDRVVGTIDTEAAIKLGERRFEPGLLADANRGILYVDEVNLLDDHIVDVLLDAAAMGWNVVEREGISFSHPSRFILVGTMNPEEGDLRPSSSIDSASASTSPGSMTSMSGCGSWSATRSGARTPPASTASSWTARTTSRRSSGRRSICCRACRSRRPSGGSSRSCASTPARSGTAPTSW